MDSLKIEELLGKGSSGKVYKALDTTTKNHYAIKKMNIHAENGVSMHAIREIKLLKKLKSKYVVELHHIRAINKCIDLVIEYMPFTLEYLISSKFSFTDNHFFLIMYQLLHAVSFIHSRAIIHRDLKPSHVLLDQNCNIKIIDFGMAREECLNMTNKISSLYYRAPETLLGDTQYSNKVDAWAVACIILEIKNGSPVFKGDDEISQCKLILSTFGQPETKYPWDDLYNVQKYAKTMTFEALFQNKFGHLVDEKSLQILREMMHLDKHRRLSVQNATKLEPIKRGESIKCCIEHKAPDTDNKR
ncbi:CMGC/CDK protein kinase [Vittaforma corneae ATCC 50505]|uniref:CMGC/CDK protein kinase n=1 Tax=Vittaforma corneae (strain ATCC 50505) TaxID=993615 RepID=L2GKN1_VITCO|nr:CMGC/CDK protein kinase [Vittaforma corneae ATCC 50505]ELA41411.1 CMGC/CDK protein kinase [Vittaforma corneae ATCC 50505]